LFQDLNDSGITVVLVTHDPNVARHAKRIVAIRDGLVESDRVVADRVRAAEILAGMA